MILNILNNGAIYEAQITKRLTEKKRVYYNFTLIRCDGIQDYKDSSYNLDKFSCSLKCRLKHYKDFKDRIFNTNFTPRIFKAISIEQT